MLQRPWYSQIRAISVPALVASRWIADCVVELPGDIEIGTLDDPSIYGGAQIAIFTAEGQPFHLIADRVPAFEGLPPQG